MTRRYKEGILPFKIVPCNEPLVARSELVLPYEMAKTLRLPRVIDEELPGPGSGRGYKPSQFVLSLILMFHGGGKKLEDLREVILKDQRNGYTLDVDSSIIESEKEEAKVTYKGEKGYQKELKIGFGMEWRLYQVAGAVVRHAHQLLLKIVAPINKIVLFCKFRLRCREIAYT
jgi:hypothetical protein